MKLSMVLAIAENGAIGHDGQLPWRLREDLRRFRRITEGGVLVMGRTTWRSIGRPLPNRISIVVTSRPLDAVSHPDVLAADCFDDALAQADEQGRDRVFLIGGRSVYEPGLAVASDIHRTLVHAEPKGDVFLELGDLSDWTVVARESVAADEHNAYPTTYEHLRRPAKAVG